MILLPISDWRCHGVRWEVILGKTQKKRNATEDQLLLAWIMKHPAKIHPVVGTTTKQRLADAYKARDIQMDLEDWFILLEASLGHPVP